MNISDKLLDDLLEDYEKPEDLLGKNGILKQLTSALLNRALEGEITHHLGYKKHALSGQGSGNSRNGKTSKSLKTDHGDIDVITPRDRKGDFEPQIVKKGQRRFDGFDEKIISLYARGMTVREIQGHIQDLYGQEVSPDFISSVTSSVIDELQAWQSRPLDRIYPIVYLDCLRVKIRDGAHVLNKAIYMAIGVSLEGKKEVLGLWVSANEGAKFWLQIVTELKNRGVEDIFIACVDGLKGFPEAIQSVFPNTQVQLCIVHLIRSSLNYVPWKDRKEVAKDLKPLYTAENRDASERFLKDFARKWDKKYPMVSDVWRRNWEGIVPFLAYPNDIRKAIYTTNAIESANRSLRKVLKNRASFPNDESALKLMYLALQNISKKWTMPIQEWSLALNQFAIIFGERMVKNV